MEKKNYKFREGFNWKIDPAIAGKQMEKLAKRHNKEITPKILVEEAENELSPFHDLFEWDDNKAGRAWRIQQARLLIGSLVVDIIIDEPVEVRAFVSIKKTNEGNVYCSISDIVDDDEKMELIISEAKKKLINISTQLKGFEKLQSYALKIDQLVLELN
jgi:hypothetical protein